MDSSNSGRARLLETIIVHYGVDFSGRPHIRPYEVGLCSQCRPGDTRCYSFRMLSSDLEKTTERLLGETGSDDGKTQYSASTNIIDM